MEISAYWEGGANLTARVIDWQSQALIGRSCRGLANGRSRYFGQPRSSVIKAAGLLGERAGEPCRVRRRPSLLFSINS